MRNPLFGSDSHRHSSRPARGLIVLLVGALTALMGVVTVADANAGTAAGHGCRPSIRALPDAGGPGAGAAAFNRHDTFVGIVFPTDDEVDARAVYWKHDRMHIIDTGLDNDGATDINDRGVITGWGNKPGTDEVVSWVRENGVVRILQGFGEDVYVDSINNDGLMMGGAFSKGLIYPVTWRHWWSKPERLPLLPDGQWGFSTSINERGVIVGVSVGPENQFDPVVWDRHGAVHPLTLRPSERLDWGRPEAVNNRGGVAGVLTSKLLDSPWRAMHWHGDRLTEIGQLPGDNNASGEGIADNGFVVGRSDRYTEQGRVSRHAFFWPGRGPMLALPALAPDWASAENMAFSVDAYGTVAGYSIDSAGIYRATIWTCAQRQAFRPPATSESSTAGPPSAAPDTKAADRWESREYWRAGLR